MELLPPKPPKGAGIDKIVKKKDEKEVYSKSSSKDYSKTYTSKNKNKEVSSSELELSKSTLENTKLDNLNNNSFAISANSSFDVPSISSIDSTTSATLDQKLNTQLDEVSDNLKNSQEKKKGFLSRIFSKKNKDGVDIKKTYKSSADEELEVLRQSLGMTDPSRKIEFHDDELKSDYVARTSWDSQVVDISAYRKSGIDENKIQAQNQTQTLSKYDKKLSVDKKVDKKDKKYTILLPAPEKEELLPMFNLNKLDNSKTFIDAKKPVSQNMEDVFKNSSKEWQEDRLKLQTENMVKDEKTLKILDAKLQKLLVSYDSKISGVVAKKKKETALDSVKLDKQMIEIQKRINNMQKKEANLLAREQKIVQKEKELENKQQKVLDLIKNNEDLKKVEIQLGENIDKYKKILSKQREDMMNAKKSYDYEKKEFNVKRRDIQIETKKLQNMYESETRKGNTRLELLSKKVAEMENYLEEIVAKAQKVNDQLKNREVVIQEKEKKIEARINQEKNILSVLREKPRQEVVTVSDFSKKILVDIKPVKVVDMKGNMAVFIDDEDAINKKIQDCQDILKEENYEDAKMLYNEIREEFSKADIVNDKKIEIRHKIRELYDEIALGIISPRN
ncbi:MAG: hypothetical protein WC758_01205 [Candidatus Woesearchaeota archaeon]|jgi:hypothetical protein